MSLKESLARREFLSNRAEFYIDLASALDDRSDAISEIRTLRDRAEARKETAKAEMYSRWLRGLDSGVLTDGLKNDVPQTDLMILNAFESAGKLPEGLRFLAKTVTLSASMRRSIQVAVATPGFVIMMIFMILALHAYKLSPVLEQIYPVDQWPLMGQVLHPVAIAVRDFGILIFLMIFAAAVAFAISIPRWTGPARVKLDNHLPYSVFRDYNGALFLTSLASLMKSGKGVVESLVQLQSMSTPWMRWHIAEMIRRLDREAAEPARALDTGAIPRAVMDRIIDYGRRSSFLEAMTLIGMESMNKTEQKINDSSAVIRNIMLMVAGGLFVIIILGTVTTGMHAQDVIRAQMG